MASRNMRAMSGMARSASGTATAANLIPEIRPASQRKDLQPVFSFNSEAIWAGAPGNAAKGTRGTSQLSRWQDLLQRVRNEGID